MISLTIEENKSYQKQKVCYICKDIASGISLFTLYSFDAKKDLIL